MNVGFMRVIPSEVSIKVYKAWMVQALDEMRGLDQNALTKMLQHRLISTNNLTAWFNVSQYIASNQPFSLRYFDPLFVQNGAMMSGTAKNLFASLARKRGITEPYVCHLSYIRPQDKIHVFQRSGLWYLAQSDDKCGPPPDKRLYLAWRN
jgi:hypothetical protein